MNQQVKPIYFPLINPNEPEMSLVAIEVQQGQRVQEGQILGTVETTKATADLTAESDGYIYLSRHRVGEMVRAGELFGYLSPVPDLDLEKIPLEDQRSIQVPDQSKQANLRLTEPARRLAEAMNIDLSRLPKDEWITEQRLRQWLEEEHSRSEVVATQEIDPNAVLIFGGGGHGKSLIELIRASGQYVIGGVIDDHKPLQAEVLGVPVVGRSNDLARLYLLGYRLMVNAVGGIGDISQRIGVFERGRSAGFIFPTVIHPTAFLEASTVLADGVQVFPHVYIGSDAKIGYGVILNSGVIVSHDCQLGDYVNLSPGAILAGEVRVGEATLIGMGVTVNLRVKIGAHCRIGNGATIKQDVPDQTIVRAGTIWPA